MVPSSKCEAALRRTSAGSYFHCQQKALLKENIRLSWVSLIAPYQKRRDRHVKTERNMDPVGNKRIDAGDNLWPATKLMLTVGSNF